MGAWTAILVIWAGLAWRGGLHAWQVMAATAAIGGLWVSLGRPLALSKIALGALLGLALWQIGLSIDPQVSLAQLAWLAALGVMLQVLRQGPLPRRETVMLALTWLALTATGLLFARCAFLMQADPEKAWVGTELVAIATHWFFPNQNLLVVAVLLPGYWSVITQLYEKPRALWLWSAWALLSVGIIFCGSRGGLLALAASGAWWLAQAWRKHGYQGRWALVGLLLVVTLGLSWRSPLAGLQRRALANAAPQLQDPFRNQRMQFWKASFLASAQRPWAGWGQGSFGQAIESQDIGASLSERNPIARYRLHLNHAHNEALEIAVEWGWPMAVLALALMLAFFWQRLQALGSGPFEWALEACLVALLAHAMVDMPLRPAFNQFSIALALVFLLPQRPALSGNAFGTGSVLLLAFLLSGAATFKRQLQFRPQAPLTLKQHLAERPYDACAWLELAKQAQLSKESDVLTSALDRALWLEPNFVEAWNLRLKLAQAAKDREAVRLAQSELSRIEKLVIPTDYANDPYCLRLLSRK